MDALHAIFLAAAATPPGAKAPEPSVNIVVDQATFEAAVAAMSDTPLDDHLSPGVDPTAQRCETIDGDLIDPCDAVIAAMVGHVRRVVFNSQPWSDAGTTAPHNAGPTCGHHNRWKTRGYHTWRDPDGRWHVYRPEGTEIRRI